MTEEMVRLLFPIVDRVAKEDGCSKSGVEQIPLTYRRCSGVALSSGWGLSESISVENSAATKSKVTLR
jgi:hypothetical protein